MYYGPQKRDDSIADLRCIRCHVSQMTLDAPMIIHQICSSRCGPCITHVMSHDSSSERKKRIITLFPLPSTPVRFPCAAEMFFEVARPAGDVLARHRAVRHPGRRGVPAERSVRQAADARAGRPHEELLFAGEVTLLPTPFRYQSVVWFLIQ